MEEKLELLRRHIQELYPLTDAEWDFVSPFFHYKKLRKHQFLIQKDELVPSEFWVISGLVKTYALDENGKEYILQFAMESYWTSDYQAFQNKWPASLYIDCLEDSEFFSLRFEDREEICRKVPVMANFFRTKSNLGYIALQQRVLCLITYPAEERFLEVVRKQPKLLQRISKKLLASYLGVSRETLSRLKAQ